MNGLLASQIFFIISSVGFVILWVFVAIFLFYLIRAARTFSRIVGLIEDGMNKLTDTTKELIEDMRENRIFNFLFKKRKKSRKV